MSKWRRSHGSGRGVHVRLYLPARCPYCGDELVNTECPNPEHEQRKAADTEAMRAELRERLAERKAV